MRSLFSDENYSKIYKWIGINKEQSKNYDIFISRINSKKCPAVVKMDNDRSKKYSWRNKEFLTKG